MTGLVQKVVNRYYRGAPLSEALQDFRTHIHDGCKVVLVCTKCESPRVRDNQLSSEQLARSAPMSQFDCLDCGADHPNHSTLRVVRYEELEAEFIAKHAEEYE